MHTEHNLTQIENENSVTHSDTVKTNHTEQTNERDLKRQIVVLPMTQKGTVATFAKLPVPVYKHASLCATCYVLASTY